MPEVPSGPDQRAFPQGGNAGNSPAPQGQSPKAGGEPAPQTGNQREGFIPRERFDEVNTKAQQAELKAQLLERQVQTMQQMIGQQPPVRQYNPNQSPTGMVYGNQQPQQPQQQRVNFDDPAYQEKFKKDFVANPAKTLREAMQGYLEEVGLPAIASVEQRLLAQLQPFVQSQVQSARAQYEAQRGDDPTFQAVKPLFDNYVQAALQRNPSTRLDNRTLHLIEQAAILDARQQGFSVGPSAGPDSPQFFSERPSGGAPAGQQQQPQMSEEERIAARSMGISEERWLANKALMRRQ